MKRKTWELSSRVSSSLPFKATHPIYSKQVARSVFLKKCPCPTKTLEIHMMRQQQKIHSFWISDLLDSEINLTKSRGLHKFPDVKQSVTAM